MLLEAARRCFLHWYFPMGGIAAGDAGCDGLWSSLLRYATGTNFTGVIKESGNGILRGGERRGNSGRNGGGQLTASVSCKCGLRARQLVEKEYTWNRVSERLSQAYRESCGATFTTDLSYCHLI